MSGVDGSRPARLVFRALLVAFVAVGALHEARAAEPERVEVPSLERRDDKPVALPAYWFAASSEPRPALVLLHGCGGPYNRRGRLSERMTEYAALFNAQGWHALVVDSLTSRGEKELCTQPAVGRRVTFAHRALDVHGALAWLAARPDVVSDRLALVGWSHGGSTVLAATNAAALPENARKPRAAVTFYPGCRADLRTGYTPSAPLLMLLGADDDWTPAQPCVELARRSGAQFEVYEGAVHGFDGTGTVITRTDVPAVANPARGVRVGGDPAARAASRERMLGFLRERLGVE